MASQTGVTDSEQVFNSLHYLVDYIASAKWFWVTLAAYCVAYLCIYFIRRGKFKHASQIAILVGSIVFMAVELISNIMFDLNLDLLPFTIQVNCVYGHCLCDPVFPFDIGLSRNEKITI